MILPDRVLGREVTISTSEGTAIFPNSCLHLILDRLNQLGTFGFSLFQDDERLDRFSDGLMRFADDSGFGHGVMADQCAFHFGRA